jgi:DNA polymerase (family 10)
MKTEAKEAARLLEEAAILLELAGESPFKARAYERAARTLLGATREQVAALARGEDPGLPGIGSGLRTTLREILASGRFPLLAELREKIPPGLLEILEIPGLGPKKVRRLWQELGITTPGELEYACLENRLVTLPGFGSRTQEKVLEGLRWRRRVEGWHLRATAEAALEPVLERLRGLPGLSEVAVAGAVRRRMEVVREAALVVSAKDPEALASAWPELERAAGGYRLTTPEGLAVRIRVCRPEWLALALWEETGSPEHLEEVRSWARSRGWEIGPEGMRGPEGVVVPATEEELYARLDLPWIPPPLRDPPWTLEALARGLPRLARAEDLQGVLHVHTNWSDGSASLEEMLEAARRLGFRYVGIADHSPSAGYANGLTVERLRQQAEAIREVAKRFPDLVVWHGTEADILPDGSLDFPDEVLAELDFVVGSVHSRLRMPGAEMTRRLVRAMENPWMDILGHPTGRLLLGRETSEVDMAAVLEAAQRTGTILEVNANPHRQDLDWRWIPEARRRGILLAVNPDAHHVEGLEDVFYGLETATKGGLQAEGLLNALPEPEARARLKRHRRRPRARTRA